MNKHSMAVYCGHSMGRDPAYAADAKKLGELMAANNIDLVYGGGNVGLMGTIASSVMDNGGDVIGITTPSLNEREPVLEGIKLEIESTLLTRKHRMIELSDAFCILPGGMGTLNEVTDIMTMHQIGETLLPIYFLNTNGYWDIFGKVLVQMLKEGFMRSTTEYNMTICETPEDVIKAYNARFFK